MEDNYWCFTPRREESRLCDNTHTHTNLCSLHPFLAKHTHTRTYAHTHTHTHTHTYIYTVYIRVQYIVQYSMYVRCSRALFTTQYTPVHPLLYFQFLYHASPASLVGSDEQGHKQVYRAGLPSQPEVCAAKAKPQAGGLQGLISVSLKQREYRQLPCTSYHPLHSAVEASRPAACLRM